MGTSVPDADESAIAAILARFVTYHPDRIDLSLDRMHRLLSDLGNPQNDLGPVIHIAGTNGKGSTTAFLDACLSAAGLRVSAYTSPHLVRFAERYKIAGEIMSDAAHAILIRAKDECTGNFFIDDEVLAEEGVTDLKKYAIDPESELMPDFFLDT